jgi:hypothetical protein
VGPGICKFRELNLLELEFFNFLLTEPFCLWVRLSHTFQGTEGKEFGVSQMKIRLKNTCNSFYVRF